MRSRLILIGMVQLIEFNLQEWFANRISEFTNDLRKPIVNPIHQAANGDDFSNTQSVSIKDGTIKVLTNLALEFEDLANTCLLVLHLEVL